MTRVNQFYSVVLDQAHLRAVIRNVELNPVRAGLVKRAEDWPWSGARAHLAGDRETGAPLLAPERPFGGDQAAPADRPPDRLGRMAGADARG